jgi:hypothetical protein
MSATSNTVSDDNTNAWDVVTYHVLVKKREQPEAERHR